LRARERSPLLHHFERTLSAREYVLRLKTQVSRENGPAGVQITGCLTALPERSTSSRRAGRHRYSGLPTRVALPFTASVSPRSSADRASASEAVCAGSIPAEGARSCDVARAGQANQPQQYPLQGLGEAGDGRVVIGIFEDSACRVALWQMKDVPTLMVP
jgi:hypothetical protein